MEKESNDSTIVFQQIITDIKSSFPVWEDFTNKAVKLHSALRCTISASTVFLETFQKLVDTAVGSRGANSDIRSLLTKLCLRHRAVENRLKNYTASIADSLITPLQERIDDWKKGVVQLDRDRTKEHKRVHVEMKKASQETSRLQKKVNKGKLECRDPLEEAIREFNTRVLDLEATEKNSVMLASGEERSHLCLLIECLKPVMELEIAMIVEAEHLKEINEKLSQISVEQSYVSEEIQENVNRSLFSYATVKRKKKALKDDRGYDMMSYSSDSNQCSLDALNLCPGVNSSESQSHRPVLSTSVSVDRSQTISYSHHRMKSRPSLSYDIYSQQSKASAASMHENPYTVPSTLASNTQISSAKVVDKIYSRPVLIMNKENGSTLKRVMTPTVPNLEALNLKTEGADNVGMKATERDDGKCNMSYSADMADEMHSLADALRTLQDNTAQLQLPYESTSAPSCQSLQCSSGYGTMTNVSVNSVETISFNSADLDDLAKSLMESCNFLDLDKYSTLPNKCQMQGSFLQDLKRSASATGFESASGVSKLLIEDKEMSDFPVDYGADCVYNSSCAMSASKPLQDLPNILPHLVGSQMLNHEVASIREDDDIDDLPLPPPPEELNTARSESLRTTSKPQQPSAHADVMQSLSAKLSVIRNSSLDKDGPYRDTQRFLSSSRQSSDDGSCVDIQSTHFNEEEVPEDDSSAGINSFENVIRRGVKLRHTICNDRSAPRLIRH